MFSVDTDELASFVVCEKCLFVRVTFLALIFTLNQLKCYIFFMYLHYRVCFSLFFLSVFVVMEINNLIKNNVLEEAYLNILSLRKEIQCEQEALGEKALPMEMLSKQKDLSLLDNNLQNQLTEIVQQSSTQPTCRKELLVQVAGIIQEEEKREGDAGQTGGWRDVWGAAVASGVKETIKKIHLDSHEENTSWLAIHLGQVGKVIVEQLVKVKAELTSCYPPSFNVFETYVLAFHKVMREHLKGLLEKVTEAKDYYVLLDFILNRYHR